jgi:hypothetical protein
MRIGALGTPTLVQNSIACRQVVWTQSTFVFCYRSVKNSVCEVCTMLRPGGDKVKVLTVCNNACTVLPVLITIVLFCSQSFKRTSISLSSRFAYVILPLAHLS